MIRFPGRLFLQNLVERRALLFQLVRRDFEQRYVGSAAGWVWGLIHPLVLLACWTFVFKICLEVPSPRGFVDKDYTLFLIAGSLPWFLFQETVQRSATSMVENSRLITKTVFPSEILPISVFFTSLINHLFSLSLVILGAGLYWGQHLSPTLLWLPVYMALTGLLGVGLGWVVSALHVYVRDTAQVVIVLVNTLWFWLTPIFVEEDRYPPQLRFLVDYNPMAFLVKAYRERLLSPQAPDVHELLVLAGYAVSAFVIGGLFFRQLKRGFADVL